MLGLKPPVAKPSQWRLRSRKPSLGKVYVLLAACLCLGFPLRAASRPHVLLVTVDTLRADALGCYGYPHDVSPTIDGLARRGTLFEDAVTTIGKTGPAFASLFTSLYPPTHGARRNGVPVRPDVPTLAEMLKAEGYTTAAFISNWTLKDRLVGLKRGFDVYDETFTQRRNAFGAAERNAESLTRDALAWLEENRRTDKAPLFFWVHYSEPHSPYELQAVHAVPQPEEKPSGWAKRWRYASEVALADHWIGTLLKGARPHLPAASSYTVFVADHGESLGEHGYWGHGRNVHWPNLHIPMIFVGPQIPAGQRDRRPVSIIDVLPTLVDLLGLKGAEDFEGRALVPFAPDPSFDGRLRFAFADRMTAVRKKGKNRYRDPLMISLQVAHVKTVWDFSRRTLEYFDLSRDPLEETPLDTPPLDTRPPIRRQLANWYRGLPKYEAASGGELTDEDLEQLRSLGYLGR